MHRIMHAVLGAAMLSLALVAAAQKPIVYPAKGQSTEKQSKDEGKCYACAKQSTGIDPAALTAASPRASAQSSVRWPEHIPSDLTLGLGTVVYDYLDNRREPS